MAAVTIRLDLKRVQRMLGLTQQALERGLVLAVAEWLRLAIRRSFEQEQSPEGRQWPALSPVYAQTKKRGRRILERTGALFNQAVNSVTIAGNAVLAGAWLPYAAIHQYGGAIRIPEIVPRKGAALRWLGPSGEAIFARRVKAHTVTIPARPYLPSPEWAELESKRVIEETIQDAIDQGEGQK